MKPLDLRPVGEHELLISWEDGHRSLYEFRALRLLCPCAGCVDEMSGQRTLKPEDVKEDVRAKQFLPVGNYALRFDFSDGHRTGLYSYELLRQLGAAGQKT